MAIWYILQPFGIFYGRLVYLMVIWYIFYRFGMLWKEKSGSPAPDYSAAILSREGKCTCMYI
jgi:hypothetical protein